MMAEVEGGICCLPDVKGARKPSTDDGAVSLLSDGPNIESLQGDRTALKSF